MKRIPPPRLPGPQAPELPGRTAAWTRTRGRPPRVQGGRMAPAGPQIRLFL